MNKIEPIYGEILSCSAQQKKLVLLLLDNMGQIDCLVSSNPHHRSVRPCNIRMNHISDRWPVMMRRKSYFGQMVFFFAQTIWGPSWPICPTRGGSKYPKYDLLRYERHQCHIDIALPTPNGISFFFVGTFFLDVFLPWSKNIKTASAKRICRGYALAN